MDTDYKYAEYDNYCGSNCDLDKKLDCIICRSLFTLLCLGLRLNRLLFDLCLFLTV